MDILILGVGMLIGILIRDIKPKAEETIEKIKTIHDKTKFFEPVDVNKSFKESKTIDEFLNQLK